MGELQLIDSFLRPFGLSRERAERNASATGVVAGPGDDCAVLAPTRGQRLVATTDAVVDGVHFDLRRCTPEDAGHKALAVNLSDLAAAGARPRWFLCALGVPLRARDQEQVAARMGRGMARLARAHGCALVGGNVTAAKEWSLTITALGEAARPLSRSGGRAGDLLIVAGLLGEAALGLRKGAPASALRAQRRPQPLVAAGLLAARSASASIDVSDGLLRDLEHLARASGCGATIECRDLPLGPAARRHRDGVKLALSGGEDYALLLAASARRAAPLLRALHKVRVPAAIIGSLTHRKGLRLLDGGVAIALPSTLGWDHLRDL